MSGLTAGLSAVGSLIGGFGRFQQGRARARALKLAARQTRQEAAIAAQIGLEEADRIGARALTLAAASGGGGLQGSARDVLADLSRQGMYRARQTIRDGNAAAIGLENDARVARAQAGLDLFTGVFDAGTTFLGQSALSNQQARMGGRG